MRRSLALAAAAATGVQVGSAMVASRWVVHEAGPATLALVRYAVALLCVLPALLTVPWPRFSPREAAGVAGLGILQFGLLIVLLNLGLAFMPAVRAAVLFNSFPLLTMAVAAALGRERLTPAKAAGVALAMLGVAATFGDALFAAVAPREWLGAVAVLGSALCGAVAAVFTRAQVARHGTLPVGALAMAATVAFLLAPALAEGMTTALPRLSAGGWGALLFIGVSSGIGYLLWLTALRHASPTHATLFLSLSPPTAALLGVVLLGEHFSPWLALGLGLIVAGLAVALLER